MDRIVEFLIAAKKSTYAGKGAESQPSRPNSHDLQYEKGDFLYIDTYLGGECFAGEEAVWKCGLPIWSMNYVGRVLSDNFSGDFLKEALLHVTEDMPYRGPAEYSSKGYVYICECAGSFEWYNGNEEIWKNGEKIYECLFHGGAIR